MSKYALLSYRTKKSKFLKIHFKKDMNYNENVLFNSGTNPTLSMIKITPMCAHALQFSETKQKTKKKMRKYI